MCLIKFTFALHRSYNCMYTSQMQAVLNNTIVLCKKQNKLNDQKYGIIITYNFIKIQQKFYIKTGTKIEHIFTARCVSQNTKK